MVCRNIRCCIVIENFGNLSRVFVCFFFSRGRRHTRGALVTGVQTCALPISGMTFVTVPPSYSPLPVSLPTSWKESASTRCAMRSRTVRRPWSCWRLTFSVPPCASAHSRRRCNSSICVFQLMRLLPRPGRSRFDGGDRLAFGDGIAFRDEDLGERAVLGRHHRNLHLHRLENHDDVPFRDRVALLPLHFPTGHG